MRWLGGLASALLLLTSASAHAQGGVGCKRVSERLPERPNPAIHRYGGGLGNELIASLPGRQLSSVLGADQVVVILGETVVWIIALRPGFGCPLDPVDRRQYDAARRRLLGTSG